MAAFNYTPSLFISRWFIYLFICLYIYLYLTNNLTNLQFVLKGRLAIHKIRIVKLIKVKSKVNANVAKTLYEMHLILILYVQLKDFLEKFCKLHRPLQS